MRAIRPNTNTQSYSNSITYTYSEAYFCTQIAPSAAFSPNSAEIKIPAGERSSSQARRDNGR